MILCTSQVFTVSTDSVGGGLAARSLLSGSAASPIIAGTKILRAYYECRGRHKRWATQYVASTPYGLDVVFAARRLSQLLAQIADKHIDDLELRLVYTAV